MGETSLILTYFPERKKTKKEPFIQQKQPRPLVIAQGLEKESDVHRYNIRTLDIELP